MEEVLIQFQQDYELRISPKALKAYVSAVRQFLVFTEKSFNKISKRNIRNWLQRLEENGFKPNTIRCRLVALKTFYRYCLEEGVVSENLAATIPFPKVEETKPRYLQREQLNQLREIAVGIDEQTLIEILYATGMRISELREMKKDDIKWSERSILIPNGKGKRERLVLFSQSCGVYLKEHLDSRTDDLPYVFVNTRANRSLSFTAINARFRQYSEQLGFKVTPHRLRHTFAAHLAQRGMPLMGILTLLGHEHPRTTHIYTRLYDQARTEMYNEWM